MMSGCWRIRFHFQVSDVGTVLKRAISKISIYYSRTYMTKNVVVFFFKQVNSV